MSFADDVAARLPEALTLPDAFRAVFDWAEGRGQRGVFTNRDPADIYAQFLTIYPLDRAFHPASSHVLFNLQDGPPLHGPPPEAMARIASIARISGDGGTLALWRDDSGRQRIVVFNHGTPHLMPDDPVATLQFLAIGYSEPGALCRADQSPSEQALEHGGDVVPNIPVAFRAFLGDAFGVEVPDRASDLGIFIPQADAGNPIRDWLAEVMPKPEAQPIPGQSPQHPFVITRELRETMGDEGIAVLRETFPYVIEEE